MNRFEPTVDDGVVWGACAGTGPGFTLGAAAVRLADDISELRCDGGIPSQVHTVITVLSQQRVLEIRVEGLSAETAPDHTTIHEVTSTSFSSPAPTTSLPSTPPFRRGSPNASCSWTATAVHSPP